MYSSTGDLNELLSYLQTGEPIKVTYPSNFLEFDFFLLFYIFYDFVYYLFNYIY